MTLSIIIPTYNEEENIGKLVRYLLQHHDNLIKDIIVSDGGSEDNTIAEAVAAGATAVISDSRGRAAQMNYGSSLAKGDVFYYVHADTLPPVDFCTDINLAIQKGYALGRYRTKFDSDKTILKLNAWFTRFDLFMCMGGDQTLFVTKDLFTRCGGFNVDMRIMEEYDFCERARQKARYIILNGSTLISARKYDTNTWLRVQWANATILHLFKKGASQDYLVHRYKQLLSYRKSF